MTGNHIVNLVMSSYNALDMKMESKLYNLNYELCASVTVKDHISFIVIDVQVQFLILF